MRYLVPALTAVLLAATTAAQAQGFGQGELPAAERYTIRVEYREYRPTLEGNMSKGVAAEPGTLLDFKDDLALDDERTFEIHAALRVKTKHKLRFSYMPVDYSEIPGHRAPRTFNFDDTRFDRDALLGTNLKGTSWFGAYEYDIITGDKGFLGIVAGARILDMDVLLVAPEQGKREQDEALEALPVLGVAMRIYFGKLSLEADASGMSINNRQAWDFAGGARFHIADKIAIMGGYHYLDLQGEDEPDEFSFRTSGYTFGLELSL
jgi:hypothetical protein